MFDWVLQWCHLFVPSLMPPDWKFYTTINICTVAAELHPDVNLRNAFDQILTAVQIKIMPLVSRVSSTWNVEKKKGMRSFWVFMYVRIASEEANVSWKRSAQMWHLRMRAVLITLFIFYFMVKIYHHIYEMPKSVL